jgi:hypothetical protein
MSLSDFAELLKEGKKQKELIQPVVVEEVSVPVVITETENLKTFLTELKETKKKQKVELQEKAVEVLPKLGDFFSLLSDSKKHTEEVTQEIKELPVINNEVVKESHDKVIETLNELKSTVETLEQKQEEIEQTIESDSELDDIRKSIKDLDKRLSRELETLKKLITTTSKQVVYSGGGSGEVRFEKLDDVNIVNRQEGDAIVYNSVTNQFTNVPIKLSGGTVNQVLVKLSDSDYDYEWQDVVVSQSTQVYSKEIDDTVSGVMYIGEAVPTSLHENPVWRIQKIIFDSSGNVDSVKYASGGLFDQIWLNRYSLVYP